MSDFSDLLFEWNITWTQCNVIVGHNLHGGNVWLSKVTCLCLNRLEPGLIHNGASFDCIIRGLSHVCLIRFWSWEFCGWVDNLWSLSSSLSNSCAVFVVWQRTLFCWESRCHGCVFCSQGCLCGKFMQGTSSWMLGCRICKQKIALSQDDKCYQLSVILLLRVICVWVWLSFFF